MHSEPDNLLSVCIVGNTGKMGAMLSQRLALAGFDVRGVDRRLSDTVDTDSTDSTSPLVLSSQDLFSLAKSRFVLVCVPVSVFEEVMGIIGPKLLPHHILMDITSVKTLPMQWMEKVFSGAVIGSHPLFGPEPDLADMRVALVRGENAGDADCLEAEKLFKSISCYTFWSDARAHDTGVGLAQSLNFTVSAAFFCALARSQGVRPFLTPSFKRHKEAARKHLTVDTAMFCEFTAMNPEFPDVIEEYIRILREAASGNLPKIAAEAASWYAES